MWNANVLSKKSEELEGEELILKLHAHPVFKAASEMTNYDRNMLFVAMAISDEDWKKLCAGELDDRRQGE